jgi:hypothetical protein
MPGMPRNRVETEQLFKNALEKFESDRIDIATPEKTAGTPRPARTLDLGSASLASTIWLAHFLPAPRHHIRIHDPYYRYSSHAWYILKPITIVLYNVSSTRKSSI